jgi:protein O-mannosyl-transferase
MARSNATVRQNPKARLSVNSKSEVGIATTTEIARWLLPPTIAALTTLVFLPSLQNGFVNWDDPANLIENFHYRGLSWSHLQWMFTTFHMSLYRPLTWVTLGLDYVIWGMNPLGYHLSSVIFHSINAVLFYFIAVHLLRLTVWTSSTSDETPLKVAAAFAALLFSIHPLRVEPVAWISARNDVVSGMFLLLSLLCYLRATAVQGLGSDYKRSMWLAWIFYGTSVLSKPAGMTFPLALLALDVYPLRRLGGGAGKWLGSDSHRIWWEKVPFILLTVIIGAIAAIGKKEAGLLFPNIYGPLDSLMRPMYAFAFYLWKTILPIGLSPLYELPVRFNPLDWPFLLSTLVVLSAIVFLIITRHRWPAALASGMCYLVILAPVSGIIRLGPAIVADRYSYLSCMGWAMLPSALMLRLYQFCARRRVRSGILPLSYGMCVTLLAALGTLTWNQSQVWHDSNRLWRHVLFNNPESGLAHYYLGTYLMERQKLDEAIEHFTEALPRIDPIYAAYLNTRYSLGLALAERGKIDGAIYYFRELVKFQPNESQAHFTLATALVKKGELDGAANELKQAVRIKPEFAEAHHVLGRLEAAQGHLDRAIGYFREAIRIKPEFAEAHQSLAQALAEQGKREQAMEQFQEALRILRSRSTTLEGRR